MTNICWWLVDKLSQLLESDEREAVCGDFAESFDSGPRALRDLVGLILRRQLAPWQNWRPWLALLGLAIPLGALVSLVSMSWSNRISIYTWLYVHQWSWNILTLPPARRDLFQTVAEFVLNFLTLVCWSWTIGFVCGSLSRRASWLNGALFCLVLFVGTLGTMTAGRQNPFAAPAFSSALYGLILPVIVRVLFVMLPFLWGMHRSRRLATLPISHTLLWVVPTIVLTLRAAPSLEGALLFGWWQLFPPVNWQSFPRNGTTEGQLLVSVAILWPIAYLVATSTLQHWRRTRASSECAL